MLKKIILSTLALFVLVQFISVDRSNPKTDETLILKASTEVMDILKKSCYDCHSHETKWPLYSNIAPVSFVVASHVKKARSALNFSKWNEIDPKIKIKRLKRAIVTVNNERMALPSYVSAHKEAKLNKNEKETLVKWFKDELALLDNIGKH